MDLPHSTPKEVRKYIFEAFERAEKTCTSPWVLDYSQTLSGVPIRSHELLTILAAVSLIINILLSLYLLWGHCFHWTKPKEQKQIVRIILFVPFLSICSFASIWSYPASGFITPMGDYYEGFAITALFLLYVQLVAPDESQRESFFHNLERRWISGKKKEGGTGSLRWFRVVWLMVFQITIGRIATVVGNEVLWSISCPLALARKWGQIALIVVQSTSTFTAVWGCIIFEKRLTRQLEQNKGFFKLLSFKGVVGLSATQQILFSVLGQYEVFFPKEPFHVSYNDFTKGLPNFVFIWELTVVAIFFLSSFEFNPYMQAVRDGAPVHASAGRALLQSFNVADIWQGLAYAITGWHREPRSADTEEASLEMKGSPFHQDQDLLTKTRADSETASP